MLVLSRQRDESIMIGDDVEITIVDVRGDKVRLGINAPKHIPVHRREIYNAIQREKNKDAQPESNRNREEHLQENYLGLEKVPKVMKFNKRDLPSLASIEEMNTLINRHNAPFSEAVATTGIGVEDTLKAITKLVLNMITTSAMIKLGKTYGNLMVDLNPSNKKLVDRSQRIFCELTGVTPQRAASKLEAADGDLKIALVTEMCAIDPKAAGQLLTACGGSVKKAVRCATQADR